jgi:hypothetical protein
MTRAGDDAEESMRRSGAMTRAGDDARGIDEEERRYDHCGEADWP